MPQTTTSPEVPNGLTDGPSDLPFALTRTSYSSFKTYMDCPEKWRREKFLGQKTGPMWAGVGGRAVHAAAEVWDLFVLGHTDFDTWEEVFAYALGNAIAEEMESTGVNPEEWKVSNKGTEDHAWWSENGPAMAESWGKWREAHNEWEIWFTPDGTPAIELEFLEEFAGTPVKGFIDRVLVKRDGSELLVVDLKSGRHPDPTIDQLLVYAAALEKKFNVRPRVGAFFDARKFKMGSFEQLDAESTPDTEERIGWFLSQAAAGEFLARPERAKCLYRCDFAATCSAAQTLPYSARAEIRKQAAK